ncbi:MAG: 30S ribosome-binding factor RbfA [Clostridia bacterium]
MGNLRSLRIDSEIAKCISDIILTELHDKDLQNQIITISRVNTSNDLSHCKVYFSVLGNDEVQKKVIETLENAKNYIRGQLAKKLNLRNTPALVFILDNSIEDGSKILKIIDELNI